MRTKFLQPKTTQIACFNDNVIVNAKVFSRSVMKVLFLIIALLFMQNLQAAYLRNIPVTKTQPDGTVLHCYASGDEYFNYLHDADGYTIIQNPITGYYVYADKRAGKLVATDYVAGRYKPESKGLKPYNIISPEEWMERRRLKDRFNERHRNSGLNHGTLNNIAVFIRFADDDEFTNSYSSIDNMFNDESQYAVSMTNYFKSASYNDLTISTTFYPMHNGEVIVSYQDIKNRCYYQPQNGLNSEGYANESEANQREFDLLERAINYVKNSIPNNLDIDHDNDGYVDNVCFIVKGYPDGWDDLLWPHQYYLNNIVTINGKRVYSYNFHLSEGSSFNTSTMCHEMNHTLGAPDLYHYSNMSVSGPNPVFSWDLMNYNINPPQHCGAYMKWQYGDWIDDIPEVDPGTYTLNPISSPNPDNIAYKISTSDPNQFYVLEYRNTNTPFESALPGSGLLIYRIDTRFYGNSYYDPSNGAYDEVYIFRPNGTYSAEGNIDMANFSFDSGRTEFSNSTSPYPFSSEGIIDNNIRIYNITDAGNTITFTYESLVQCDAPTNLSASLSDHTVTLSWTAAEGVSSYRVYRNNVLIASNVTGTSYTDNDMEVGQNYYALRSNCDDGSISAMSNVVNVNVSFNGYITVVIGNLKYTLNWDTAEAEVYGPKYYTYIGDIVIPESVNYTIDDITINYTVKSIRENAFKDCYSMTGSLVIPNTVTSVGESAFDGCSGLDGSLTLSNSLITIGNRAFYGCNFTSTLTIPHSVTTIGDNAFVGCDFTGSLTIPNTVTSIGDGAFAGSGFTGSLKITNSVTSISSSAFRGCGFTGLLTIPHSVTSIGDYAFLGCDFTGSLTIPNSVTSIGSYAFKNCAFTGSLSIGNSVTSIGDYAFDGCNGFTGSLTIPNSVTSIGNSAFRDCSFNGLAIDIGVIPNYFKSQCGAGFTGSLTIGNHVTSIGNYAFYDCNFTGSLTIGNSVTSIGNCAFYGCGFTGSLIIPNSATTIGDYAFDGCDFTGSLTIPNSVTTIGDYAFSGCAFSGLTIDMVAIPDNFRSTTGLINHGSLTLGNSVTSIGNRAFDVSDIWSSEPLFTGQLIIPNSVTTIGDNAFSCCAFTGSLTIPNSVTSIGDGAFGGCNDLVGPLTIGNHVASIGNSAFYNCSGFTGTLTIPNSVTTIGNYAFYGCSGFTGALTIPNSVTTIGDYAFQNCSGLNGSLMLSNSLITIGNSAFRDGVFTGPLTIPNSVTSIGDYAFYHCTGFTGLLTIPNSVTSIGGYAFENCAFTGSLSIGNSVTSIGNYAFAGCGFTGALTIPNSVTTIGNSAFSGCSGFTGSLIIGNSVESIGGYAFNNCIGFNGSLIIPNSVITIGGTAFQHCSGFNELTIGNSVESIGYIAFGDCQFKAVRLLCTTPPTTSYSFQLNTNTTPVFVPCGSLDDYKSANYWSTFTNLNESQYNLIVTQNDAIGGVVSVLKYADCEDDQCSILAEPNIGYDFIGWYVDDEFSTSEPLYDFAIIDDITYEARFVRNASLIVANGTSDLWSDSDTWDLGKIPSQSSTVAIRKNITLDVDATIKALGIYDYSVLTIQSGVTLTIIDTLGTWLSYGVPIIIEDGGQIVHSSNGARARIDKSVDNYTNDDDGWNLISYPITGSTPIDYTNVLQNHYDLYYYDEPNQAWINHKDESNSFTEFEAGRGYLYSNSGDPGDASGVKIGEGTSTTSISPLNTYYKYSIAENLFLASELETAGVPTTSLGALCWYATNETGYQQSNISIWMANVADAELTSMSHNVSEMTLVYTGDMTPTVGWNVFVFNESAFTWDGTSNLLVCVQRNNGVYNGSIYWQSHYPGFTAMSYKYNDNNAYDMDSETYSMTTSLWARPSVIFQTIDQVGQFEDNKPITLTFTGEIENGTAEVTVPLSYTGGNKLSGFNLVGNPFVHNVISYETTNVADGCFRVNDTKTNLIVSTISNENPLKPAEGFFVKATGDNASVTFNSSSKRSTDDRGMITLEIVQNDKIIDRFVVKEDGDNLNKISLRGNHTEIYAKSDGHKLALVPLKSDEQAVNFKSADIGMYTINVAVENMDISYLHLVDNITGANIDLLRNPSYSYYASASDNESRFRLIFDPSVSPGNSDVFAYQNGDDIIVNGNGVLQVYDVMGRMLATQRVTGVETVSKPSQDGVYIYRLINGNDVQTQKIVVR